MQPFRGMGMLPPWMMPMFMTEDQPRSQTPEIIVPARVNKAMEFLSHLSRKRQKGAAVSDNNIEVLTPDDLSNWEVNAQNSALQLLSNYFDGKLEPDRWEQARFEAMQRQAEGRDEDVTIIRCPMCSPFSPNPQCPLCHGNGRLLTKAAGPAIPQPQPEEPQGAPEGSDET